MFGQSIINQTIRKPDGSTETKQIIRDSTGNVKTTITRTKDGKTETVTSYGKPGEDGMLKAPKVAVDDGDTGIGFWMDKNIFVNKNGYALPMNLWWPAVVVPTTTTVIAIVVISNSKITNIQQIIINNYNNNNILIVFASISLLSFYYLLLYYHLSFSLLSMVSAISVTLFTRSSRNRIHIHNNRSDVFCSSFLSLRWNFDIF